MRPILILSPKQKLTPQKQLVVMIKSNISNLEGSVSKLLDSYDALQLENKQLRIDRQNLLDKNKQASAKIESMIDKLKEVS